MMEHWEESKPDPRWHAIYDAVAAILRTLGTEYRAGRGDWYIMDEDTGQLTNRIELLNLDLLRPSLVQALQALLLNLPEWTITVRVEGLTADGGRPGMGLFIYSDSIIDDLRREFLPSEFAHMRFD
jgi:hypothetical protein